MTKARFDANLLRWFDRALDERIKVVENRPIGVARDPRSPLPSTTATSRRIWLT